MKPLLTRRGASALRAIVLFSFVSWLSGNPTLIIASLTLVLIVLIEALNFKFNSRGINKLKLERNVTSSSLRVGNETEVNLAISNLSRTPIVEITLADNVPEAFKVVNGSISSGAIIKGQSKKVIRYSICPLQMGDYDLGDVSATSNDALGFATFSKTIPLKSRVQVYPKLRQMRLSHFSRTIQSIRSTPGPRVASRAGSGLDFRGIRDYNSGDDFKKIAWKSIAKSTRHSLMIREFESDHEISLAIVLYGNESLLDGPIGHRKLDYVAEAVVAVAHTASLEGDKISFAYGHQYFPLSVPGESRQRQAVRALRSTYNLRPNSDQDARTLIQHLFQLQNSTIIVIITDSEVENPAELETLRRLSHHEILILAMKTTSLFDTPNLDKSQIGFEAITRHEHMNIQRLAAVCHTVGIPFRDCAPHDLLKILFQVYVAAKTRG